MFLDNAICHLYFILIFTFFGVYQSDQKKDTSSREITSQDESNQNRAEQGLVFPDDTWQIATPELQGIDPDMLQQAFRNLADMGKAGRITVVRNGYIIGSHGDITRPFDAGIYSASKSLIALIGARLIQDEQITLDMEIPLSNDAPGAGEAWDISVFNSGTPHPNSPLATCRHFMTMTSDFGLDNYNPGNHFAYNNNAVHFYGTYMNRTYYRNIDPVAFLEQGLFDHIGGHQDPITYNGEYGGWGGGWAVSSRDLARTGLLMLAQGNWDGTQVLPAWWVDACFENQIPADATANEDKGPNSRWNQRFTYDLKGHYSFGWWLPDHPKWYGNEVWIAASGRGGNLILVLPDVNIVVAVVNNEVNSDKRPPADAYVNEIKAAVVSD